MADEEAVFDGQRTESEESRNADENGFQTDASQVGYVGLNFAFFWFYLYIILFFLLDT